jgi:hypothetical protein
LEELRSIVEKNKNKQWDRWKRTDIADKIEQLKDEIFLVDISSYDDIEGLVNRTRHAEKHARKMVKSMYRAKQCQQAIIKAVGEAKFDQVLLKWKEFEAAHKKGGIWPKREWDEGDPVMVNLKGEGTYFDGVVDRVRVSDDKKKSVITYDVRYTEDRIYDEAKEKWIDIERHVPDKCLEEIKGKKYSSWEDKCKEFWKDMQMLHEFKSEVACAKGSWSKSVLRTRFKMFDNKKVKQWLKQIEFDKGAELDIPSTVDGKELLQMTDLEELDDLLKLGGKYRAKLLRKKIQARDTEDDEFLKTVKAKTKEIKAYAEKLGNAAAKEASDLTSDLYSKTQVLFEDQQKLDGDANAAKLYSEKLTKDVLHQVQVELAEAEAALKTAKSHKKRCCTGTLSFLYIIPLVWGLAMVVFSYFLDQIASDYLQLAPDIFPKSIATTLFGLGLSFVVCALSAVSALSLLPRVYREGKSVGRAIRAFLIVCSAGQLLVVVLMLAGTFSFNDQMQTAFDGFTVGSRTLSSASTHFTFVSFMITSVCFFTCVWRGMGAVVVCTTHLVVGEDD